MLDARSQIKSLGPAEPGALLLAKGDKKGALQSFGKAVAGSPKDLQLYRHIAMLLQQSGMGEESVRFLQMGIEAAGVDSASLMARSEFYTYLGAAYAGMKDYDSSASAFRNAIEAFPQNAEAYNGWGYVYADANIRLDEALRLTKRAVELAPNDGNIVDSLGWAYFRLGRYEEARKHLRRAVELQPHVAELRYHLGMAYEKIGDKKSAWVEYRKALKLKKGYQDAQKRLNALGDAEHKARTQPPLAPPS